MKDMPVINEERRKYRQSITELKLDICRAMAQHKDADYSAIETALIDILHGLKEEQISEMFNEGSK